MTQDEPRKPLCTEGISRFMCTLPDGHDGLHEAWADGDRPVFVWGEPGGRSVFDSTAVDVYVVTLDTRGADCIVLHTAEHLAHALAQGDISPADIRRVERWVFDGGTWTLDTGTSS